MNIVYKAIENHKQNINKVYNKNMKHLEYKVVGQIRTKVTYLSMDQKPKNIFIPKVEESININKEDTIDISLYRELYHKVGEPLTWTGRKLLSDQELSQKIHSPYVSIFILSEHLVPIGFIEFEKNKDNNEVEIGLFGITPEFQGKKLGIYLLNWGINHTWEVMHCSRLWLHTCDLDHEKALGVYLRSGFTIQKEDYEFVDQIAPTTDIARL